MNYFEQVNQTEQQIEQSNLAEARLIANVSRRSFLKSLGIGTGALVIGAQIPTASAIPMKWADKPVADGVFSPSVYLKISRENTVTVVCHRSEMGQGIRTSIPMIIADELGVNWNDITVEQALADKKYGSQNTDGSRSIRRFYTPLKEAAASARMMLAQAAANRWKVDAKQCEVKETYVWLKNSDKKFMFGELVEDAAKLDIPEKSALVFNDAKPKYINQNTNVALIDGQEIVTGKTVFGIDVVRDGMKIAVIARPPVLASRVKSFDATEAKKMKGVVDVIKLDDLTEPPAFKPLGGVAVIANNTWAAIEGRKKLSIEWEWSSHRDTSSEKQKQALKQSVQQASKVLRNKGDVKKALSAANKMIEAEYYVPALVHAPMEPPMATAEFKDGVMNIWACTQAPQGAQSTVAGLTGVKPENINLYVTLLGGGFGRKSKADFVAEAAILAKRQGYPVKVVWTREDDIQQGFYHAESYQKISAGIAGNKVTAWQHKVAEPPIGSTFQDGVKVIGSEANLGLLDMPYEIDNVQCVAGEASPNHRIGWLRSVTNINHAFAVCSFADEIAHQLKRDPKDHLLSLIGSDRTIDLASQNAEYGNYGEEITRYPIDTARLKSVVQRAATMSNWDKAVKQGRFMGIAVHRSFVSYVATVVEVSKNKSGKIKLENIWMACDCGTIVNLDRVKSQMEGAAIFGISIAFYGKVTWDKGEIEQSNYHNYQVARMSDTPPIHIDVIINDAPPGGVGEPGVPPVAPAICNAIFAATGKRYRELPLMDQDILA